MTPADEAAYPDGSVKWRVLATCKIGTGGALLLVRHPTSRESSPGRGSVSTPGTTSARKTGHDRLDEV